MDDLELNRVCPFFDKSPLYGLEALDLRYLEIKLELLLYKMVGIYTYKNEVLWYVYTFLTSLAFVILLFLIFGLLYF